MMPSGLPIPTVATVFEVIVDGKIYSIRGAALQRWIVKQRTELKGSRGQLFGQGAPRQAFTSDIIRARWCLGKCP
jgi:hypothetical protein